MMQPFSNLQCLLRFPISSVRTKVSRKHPVHFGIFGGHPQRLMTPVLESPDLVDLEAESGEHLRDLRSLPPLRYSFLEQSNRTPNIQFPRSGQDYPVVPHQSRFNSKLPNIRIYGSVVRSTCVPVSLPSFRTAL